MMASSTSDPRRELPIPRGVVALSVGWALTFSVVTASITTANLAGAAFAPSSGTHTLPLAMLIVSQSGWSFVLPKLFELMGGRLHVVYRVTSAVGIVGSAVNAVACKRRSFVALCVGCLGLGLPAAAGQSFRFAALSLVPGGEKRAQTVGLVLTGGIAGALVGPSVAAASRDAFSDATYAGVYLYTAAAFGALFGIMCVPGLVHLSRPTPDDPTVKTPVEAEAEGGTPAAGKTEGKGEAPAASAVAVAFGMPSCVAAVAVASLSYAAMAFLMSPTPLAMKDAGFSFTRTSRVIMIHMLGMYAPSMAVGKAVAGFGWSPLAIGGAALYVGASAVVGSNRPCFVASCALLYLRVNAVAER